MVLITQWEWCKIKQAWLFNWKIEYWNIKMYHAQNRLLESCYCGSHSWLVVGVHSLKCARSSVGRRFARASCWYLCPDTLLTFKKRRDSVKLREKFTKNWRHEFYRLKCAIWIPSWWWTWREFDSKNHNLVKKYYPSIRFIKR